MSEINNPAVPTYYTAYSNGVRHAGVTMPGQVTTSGQPNFEKSENVDELFIPADPRLIEGLSRGLYQLIDPTGDGLYAEIIWHPSGAPDAWPLLQLRSADIVPVNLAANPQPLIEVLTAFVQGGGLTQQELDGIVGAVGAMAGRTIQLQMMIPQSWQKHILTREQATAKGYFGGESVGLGRLRKVPGR